MEQKYCVYHKEKNIIKGRQDQLLTHSIKIQILYNDTKFKKLWLIIWLKNILQTKIYSTTRSNKIQTVSFFFFKNIFCSHCLVVENNENPVKILTTNLMIFCLSFLRDLALIGSAAVFF